MATKYLSAFALLIATTPAHTADWYGTVGLIQSYEPAAFEGQADDSIERCCGWVSKAGKGDYTTGGDDWATGGRISIGAETDAGAFEVGWANLGTWNIHVDGGDAATGERRVSAVYGAGVWPIYSGDQWSISSVAGIHRASVSVRVRNNLVRDNGNPEKIKIDDHSNGYLIGLRASYGSWSVDVTEWGDVGYDHTTGSGRPMSIGISYRFEL